MRHHVAAIGPLLAAILVHLPPLFLPLIGDDYHSLHQAAVTRADLANFVEPWMGGVFRGLPKLYFMGTLDVFGTHPLPYRLVNLALHVFCTWMVARLVRRWTGSAAVAAVAALCFGIGLGGYLRAVFQISNVTLLGATACLLPAISAAASRRWLPALVLFVAAVLCHEIVLVAPLLLPFIAAAERRRSAGREVLANATAPGLVVLANATAAGLVVLGVLALAPLGRLHEIARRVVEQTWFVMFPINTPERMLRRVEAPGEAVAVLVALGNLFTDQRAWMGLAVLAGAVWIVRSCDPRRVLAVAWTYLFLVPPAWLIVTAPELGPLWQFGWLERRYIYLPGAALAGLAGAAFVAHRARRPRLAGTWLIALLAWIVLMDGITWDNYRRLSQTGDELARRARFETAMRELEPLR